jgi:hypothetical protein
LRKREAIMDVPMPGGDGIFARRAMKIVSRKSGMAL